MSLKETVVRVAKKARKLPEKITCEKLRELCFYDPEQGVFISIKHRFPKYVGVIRCRVITKRKYVYVTICGRAYREHHLAWLYVYGEYPASLVDHIDGDRTNNRIKNLRLIDAAGNTHNIFAAYKSNKSTGLLGANYCKTEKKYLARIMAKGKMHNLGAFKTAEEAHDKYMRAKAILHPASVDAKRYIEEHKND